MNRAELDTELTNQRTQIPAFTDNHARIERCGWCTTPIVNDRCLTCDHRTLHPHRTGP